MAKPRITASMLRKRPQPRDPAQPPADQPEDAASAVFDAQSEHSLSMVDDPLFRAPQFGIKPRPATPTVRVLRASKRRVDRERP
ncbi:hypothetical protein [Sinimarinibacterium thermocellulolyticum]|uniref:Uncharacterized protein n=1 Tax=Sinimarinibacterium thermocellulolyticum TaxID=3170016 RepID=A0ABV2A5N6_9GAMM